MMKKFCALAMASVIGLSPMHMAHAAWPDDKPIEIVVGFSPGGGTDIMARLLAPFLKERLGAKAGIVVSNKPGAGGEIATTYIARAQPDGYTIGFVNVPGFVFTPMYKKTSYQPDDLQLIARIVDDPTVMVANIASGYTTLEDVVKQLKKEPGSVSIGFSGVGSQGHLAFLQLQQAAGVEATPIPYAGGTETRAALVGNHLDIGYLSIGEVLPDLRVDKPQFKVVSLYAPEPSGSLPGISTARKEGYNLIMSSERGLAAPKGLPPQVLQRLETAIKEILKDPAFVKAAVNDAHALSYLSGDQWKQALKANARALEPWVEVIQKQL